MRPRTRYIEIVRMIQTSALSHDEGCMIANAALARAGGTVPHVTAERLGAMIDIAIIDQAQAKLLALRILRRGMIRAARTAAGPGADRQRESTVGARAQLTEA